MSSVHAVAVKVRPVLPVVAIVNIGEGAMLLLCFGQRRVRSLLIAKTGFAVAMVTPINAILWPPFLSIPPLCAKALLQTTKVAIIAYRRFRIPMQGEVIPNQNPALNYRFRMSSR